MNAIDRMTDEMDGFRLLKGVEVDILEDGTLALPDDLLGELDVRVCVIHTGFDMPEDQQTERLLRAMDNPHFNILGHPTCWRINRQRPIAFDFDRIVDAAREKGCFLELTARPDRLDLSNVYCKRAKERGLQLVISSDAHVESGLDDPRYGIDQARRGWLGADDVLNTRAWDKIASAFER